MSTRPEQNTGGLWANMSDVQKMAHSIKTGSDWQNRAGNAGLRDVANEYLQYDNTPGIQRDNMDNGYYGWSPSHGPMATPAQPGVVRPMGPTTNYTPPPRTSNASNTAGMMGAVTNAIRGMNGTQTPEQLQQTRNEQTQAPTSSYIDDMPAIAVSMPSQLASMQGYYDKGIIDRKTNRFTDAYLSNPDNNDDLYEMYIGGFGLGDNDFHRGLKTQAMNGWEAQNRAANPQGTSQEGLTFGGGSGYNTSYTQPYGNPAPINQPSASSPPGHGGGNPGFSGMLSNPAESLAALKALTDRLRSRGG